MRRWYSRLRVALTVPVLAAAAGVAAGEARASLPPGQILKAFEAREGVVGALVAGHGYAAWTVTGGRRRGTRLWMRAPDGAMVSQTLRYGAIRDLKIVRGPSVGGVRGVVLVGLRCPLSAGSGDRSCTPIGFPMMTRTQQVPDWASSLFTAERHAFAPVALDDDRRLVIAATERVVGGEGRPESRCKASLESAADITGLPAIPICFGASRVELRGSIATVYGSTDANCACDMSALWAIDLDHLDLGWTVIDTYGESRYASGGLLSWASTRDGVIGLDGGTSYDPERDRTRSLTATLRKWPAAGAADGVPRSKPDPLLPSAVTSRYSAIANTGTELLAVATERGSRRRGTGRSMIVRVPYDLAGARDIGATP